MPHNPFSYAHTLVGVGCMVVNAQDEVLVVQVSQCAERGSSLTGGSLLRTRF